MKRQKKKQKKKLKSIQGHNHVFTDNNDVQYTLTMNASDSPILPISWFRITYLHDIKDYPWIRDLEHLSRINKYRRRMGQIILQFSDNDIAELALTTGLL